MPSTTYATITELKQRVSIEAIDATADTMLQHQLDSAAETVDRETRGYRPGYEAFSVSASEIRYFDDYGDGIIIIDDLLSISLLTVNAATITSTYYYLAPYNTLPREELRLRFDQPVTGAAANWYGYPYQGVSVRQVAVTGTWGYCAAANRPAMVKEVTLKIAELYYHEVGMSITDLMQAIRSPVSEKMKTIREQLESLRRFRVGHRTLSVSRNYGLSVHREDLSN